jgi:hypothetical protein
VRHFPAYGFMETAYVALGHKVHINFDVTVRESVLVCSTQTTNCLNLCLQTARLGEPGRLDLLLKHLADAIVKSIKDDGVLLRWLWWCVGVGGGVGGEMVPHAVYSSLRRSCVQTRLRAWDPN